MKSICKALSMLPQAEQGKALLALRELKPLFERFGISTLGEVLQKEMRSELASDHSMYMYNVTTNKLSSTLHATAAFYPEPIASVDYSGLRGNLPLVTIVEGVVAVYGDVCERALIDPDTNEITWSRSMDDADNTFEHGIIAIDPTTLSGYGQVKYSRDEDGADLIPMPQLQFLVVGTTSRAAIVSTTQIVSTHDESITTTSTVTTALSILAPSGDWVPKSETTSMMMDSGVTMDLLQEQTVAVQSPRIVKMSKLKIATPKEIHKLKARQFSLMAAASTAQPTEAIATTTATVVDNTISGKPIPIVPSMRYNMIYDDSNYKGQVAPTNAIPFGPLDLAFGRLSTEGLAGMSLSLPDLDNLLILINKKMESGDEKLQSLYANAVGKVAGLKNPNFGKVKGTITLTPDALTLLDNLKDETEEYTSHWTFKTQLDTDISIPMIFAEMQIIFGDDRKTILGTITEYDTRSTTMAGKP